MKRFLLLYDCGTPRMFEENKYQYVFRTASHAAMDNVSLARYLKARNVKIERYNMINQDYAWGQDSRKDFMLAMEQIYKDTKVEADLPKFGAGQYGTEISALFTKPADILHSSLWGGDLQAFILQATALSFCGGYWKSGDIGTLDADGFLRIHDRKKDMINRGGYKVFSIEVEICLMSHPRVLEAAAVGVPCPVLGERVHVFVHASADGAPGEALAEELKNLCRRDLADYKVPDAINFTASPLPRNANAKLLKRELRERLLLPSANEAQRSG